MMQSRSDVRSEPVVDNSDTPLRYLQQAELDILRQVLQICERHGITYYMLGGTLLGAVRHKGFIPWDDDIDIGMPRPDYERFMTIAEQELPDPYRLHTVNTKDSEYCYYFIRVENTSIKLKRRATLKDVVIPAWIDVFPLDGVPEEARKRTAWLRKCGFYYDLFRASQASYLLLREKKKRSLIKRAARTLFFTLRAEKLISTRLVWRMLDKALKENRYEDCASIINFCGYWRLKELFPKTAYGEGKLYSFEDLLLNGPADYEYVLTQMYGNYMTPPPPEKREHHYIELLTDIN